MTLLDRESSWDGEREEGKEGKEREKRASPREGQPTVRIPGRLARITACERVPHTTASLDCASSGMLAQVTAQEELL